MCFWSLYSLYGKQIHKQTAVILFLRDLGKASLPLDEWLGSLLPALLIAIILNWYSLPFWSPWTVALVLFVSIVSHNCQPSSSPMDSDNEISFWFDGKIENSYVH